MIHIAIGTKAQFIKTFPIMQKLKEKGIEFNLIDLGQHSLITRGLRDEFGLKDPDVCLSRGENVSRLSRGLIWIAEMLKKGVNSRWVKEKVFLNREGVCLIHGDTVSTVLALYLAKRARIKAAHIEAGLRSWSFLEPFPEEILRVMAMRGSDILFAPSAWARGNLKKMGLDKKSVLISGNTSLESTFYSLEKKVPLELDVDKFALVTVHRMENIFSKRRFKFILDVVAKITEKLPVVFVQHPPTINQLRKFKLQAWLESLPNIRFLEIQSHAHFISLLNNCQCVFTDGGSIQEESFYLNKPCLLFRKRTERLEGLDQNVVISQFSGEKIDYFLDNYKSLKVKDLPPRDISPSEDIVKYLTEKGKFHGY